MTPRATGYAGSAALHAALLGGLLAVAAPPAARPPMTVDLTLIPPSASPGPAEGMPPARPAAPRPARAAPPAPVAEATAPEPTPAAVEAPSGLAPAESDSPVALPAGEAERSAFAGEAAASSAGDAQGPAPSGAGGGGEARGAYVARNFGYIREAIQKRVSYPVRARRMGWAGRVVVAFRILPDGEVEQVRILAGSGFAPLDDNAVEAVRLASPFPRPPAEAEIVVPVAYSLE